MVWQEGLGREEGGGEGRGVCVCVYWGRRGEGGGREGAGEGLGVVGDARVSIHARACVQLI